MDLGTSPHKALLITPPPRHPCCCTASGSCFYYLLTLSDRFYKPGTQLISRGDGNSFILHCQVHNRFQLIRILQVILFEPY